MTIHTLPQPGFAHPAQALPAPSQPLGARSAAAPQVALVMPCYNEARRLDLPRIANFLFAHPGVTLIAVNDGSTDATQDLLELLALLLPAQVQVLALPRNGGKAEAVRQGLRAAMATRAPLLAYWDADLATPLESLEDFARIAQRMPEVSVVFGSRRPLLGHRIERRAGRRVISALCAAMARMALGLPVRDTQCGAKLLRACPALAEVLAEPFAAGWLFDVELFARLKPRLADPQRAFFELPLTDWREIEGSKVSARAVLRAGLAMLRLIWRNRLTGAARPAPVQPE